MLSRLSTAERVAAGSALVGIVASFLTWYGYTAGTTQISVNAFRSSLLGDVYFIACTVVLIAAAGRARMIQLGRVDSRVSWFAAIAALVALVLQFGLTIAAGHSMHKGFALAAIAAVALIVSERRASVSSAHRGLR